VDEDACLGTSGCSTRYYPAVRFVTARGETVETEIGGWPGIFDRSQAAVGTAIIVYHDPADPSDARLASGWTDLDTLLVVLLLATYSLTFFAVFRHLWRARRQPSAPDG
jgi:hypothetical protein